MEITFVIWIGDLEHWIIGEMVTNLNVPETHFYCPPRVQFGSRGFFAQRQGSDARTRAARFR